MNEKHTHTHTHYADFIKKILETRANMTEIMIKEPHHCPN